MSKDNGEVMDMSVVDTTTQKENNKNEEHYQEEMEVEETIEAEDTSQKTLASKINAIQEECKLQLEETKEKHVHGNVEDNIGKNISEEGCENSEKVTEENIENSKEDTTENSENSEEDSTGNSDNSKKDTVTESTEENLDNSKKGTSIDSSNKNIEAFNDDIGNSTISNTNKSKRNANEICDDENSKQQEVESMDCTEEDKLSDKEVTENVVDIAESRKESSQIVFVNDSIETNEDATENILHKTIQNSSDTTEIAKSNDENTNKSDKINKESDEQNNRNDDADKARDKNDETLINTDDTTIDTDSVNKEFLEVDVDSDRTEKTAIRENSVSDSDLNEENAVFVQVNSEKDDSERSSAEQGSQDIDPIGSSEWSQSNEPSFVSDLDEADECIIPDTNREESASSDSPKEPDTTETTSSTASVSSESDTTKLSEKYLVSITSGDDQAICMICNEKTLCKYNCTKDKEKTNICSENCLSKLKEQHPDNVIVRQLRVKNFSLDKSLRSSVDNICCTECRSDISDMNNSLSWEALDFCDEQCLTKHQKLIGSFCANCKIEVKDNFLGKYCVRFGYNVRQFCSSICLEEYKKNSKVCSYCQDDISGNTSGFLTSIADKGLTKDFCTAQCMQKYNDISKHIKGTKVTDDCCVCHKKKQVEIEFDYRSKINLFCGEPCFVAFKYVNDVSPQKCDMCCKYFIAQSLNQPYLIRYDGNIRRFCLKTCQNIYITTNRKIVSCCWCKVKKYNFDMIQKYAPDSSVLIICSLTCLNFFNASVNATKTKKKRCDFCNKICKGQYHISLADDSMKNFCSYPCVQEYQSKYLLAPARYADQPVAISTTVPNRVTTRKSSGILQQRKQVIPEVPGPLPIITSVRSLAPTITVPARALRSKSSVQTIATITTVQTEPAGPPPVRRVVVLRPPDLPHQRNVATLVKPITCDAEVEFKPEMVDKAVQTEDLKDSLILVPIPVPIYVPSPMQMYNLVHPVPIPFPLPVPIPMFIPVTKQTGGIVLKEIKKNEVRDPYEADLLMMAELVAGEVEKKENTAVCESDNESVGDHAPPEPSFSPEPPDASNTFGDDMLQMALKMATDFEEPAVDLEGALTASTITATAATSEPTDDVAPIQAPVERTTFRGRRRGRPPRHGSRGRGRGRPPTQQPEIVTPTEPEPQQPPEPVEKPDANMCLKYTFGVNAWKQWVTTKNAELEKSSRGSKPFKPDLLQLTSDELNYSLCLFVKEVRKPNTHEYAPDTIYYLCLGIQQYLFENGRIDNIFCDSYYESFTDCLDEVCKKFSTLYNDSQYIVTRVEEEHLWESKQLGAHSPHVLLSTLMFFNTKHFNLTNVEEHMQLSFSHIMKHWKRVPNQPGTPKNSTSRNILLRFYPPQSAIEGNNRKKKVYEQQENEENPLRCPVKLYEFYLSKCPESVKTRNDVFYLLPERSCVPDSPVWYSTMALGKEALEKMLHRVEMVKEINVALLAS